MTPIDASVPRYVCHRAAGPISIDGVLDESAWQAAPTATPFWLLASSSDHTAALAPYQTEAKLLWDEDNLYVSFWGESPDVWTLPKKRDDSDLGSFFEILLDVKCDSTSYYEFAITPGNAVRDLYIPFPAAEGYWRRWAQWDAKGLRTAVRIDGELNNWRVTDRGWTMESAMPLRNFLDGEGIRQLAGTSWRMNLCRQECAYTRPDPELSGWSRPIERFTDPRRFGIPEFSDQVVG